MNRIKEGWYKYRLRSFKGKPMGKKMFYTTYIALPWAVIGCLVFTLTVLLTAIFSPDILTPTQLASPVIVVTVMLVLMILFTGYVDLRRGYIDAIHRHYLERRAQKLLEYQTRVNTQESKQEV